MTRCVFCGEEVTVWLDGPPVWKCPYCSATLREELTTTGELAYLVYRAPHFMNGGTFAVPLGVLFIVPYKEEAL